MKLSAVVARIWNSPVGSNVVSAIIFTGLSFLLQKVLKLVVFLRIFFEIKLPIGIFLSVTLGLIAVIVVSSFRVRKERREFAKEKSEFQSINDKQEKEIEKLRERISVLEKLPENPKLKKFKQGDVVIRNVDKEKFTQEEYSVINIDSEKQEVIVRDRKGETHSFLPDELLTKTEADKYLKEMLDFVGLSGNTNR